MRRLLPWLAGLLVAGLLALGWAPRDPSATRPWQAKATSYSPGPAGTKALYLLLSELGLELGRLRRPSYAGLRSSTVLWAFTREPFGRADRRELLAFVERGGTLVAPPAALSVILETSGAGPCTSEAAPARAASGILAGELRVEPDDAPRVITGCREPDRVHASVEGVALVAEWHIGSGRAVSLGLDGIARNETIGKGENGPFLARLALGLGEEHLFDEFSTGFGEGSWSSLLVGVPYRWAFAQLALALALTGWALVPRRRPAEARRERQRRRSLDHVDAVAALWQREGDASLPLGALLAGLDATARAQSGDAGERPFLSRVERMRPDLAARARQVWNDAGQLAAQREPPPAAVLRAVNDIEALRWEISRAWAKPPAT